MTTDTKRVIEAGFRAPFFVFAWILFLAIKIPTIILGLFLCRFFGSGGLSTITSCLLGLGRGPIPRTGMAGPEHTLTACQNGMPKNTA